MNSRPTQFDTHEITASSRQHASRIAVNSFAPQPRTLSGHLHEEEQSAPSASRRVGTFELPPDEPPNGARLTDVPAARRLRITKRAGNQEPSTVPLDTQKGLVDVHAAARFLAVSVSTLYGWVWQRRISFVKVGRAVRFDTADLQRFVQENRIQARVVRKL